MKSRVLMTTTAYPPSTGGVQLHVQELRDHLRRYDADIATLWLSQRHDWLLGTTLRLPEPAQPVAAPGVHSLGWSGAARARMLPWALGYYAIPAIAARQIAAQMVPFVEKVVSSHHVLIHNHRIGREFLAQASLTVARRRGLPFVLSPHHHPKWRGYRYEGWLQVYRAADMVITQTESELRELEQLGVRRERLVAVGGTVGDSMPGNAARFRARIGASDNPIVLFVGQLYEYKGVADLLAAVEAVRAMGNPVELVYIGPETGFSRRFFGQRARPGVHVLGKVDEQTKWDALEAAMVLCLPSRHEALGRVFLEAWSKSKPVIGARVPAVSEVISEAETGLLVDPGSRDQLAQAIRRLLLDPDLAARLGARGAQEVATRFSWERVIDGLERAYDVVVARVRGLRSAS
jgi:glycosyltransferase involved in cell wall biosynthesis